MSAFSFYPYVSFLLPKTLFLSSSQCFYGCHCLVISFQGFLEQKCYLFFSCWSDIFDFLTSISSVILIYLLPSLLPHFSTKKRWRRKHHHTKRGGNATPPHKRRVVMQHRHEEEMVEISTARKEKGKCSTTPKKGGKKGTTAVPPTEGKGKGNKQHLPKGGGKTTT